MASDYEVNWEDWSTDTKEEKTLIEGCAMNLWQNPYHQEIAKLYNTLDQIRDITEKLLEHDIFEEKLHKIRGLCYDILNKPQ